MKEAYTYWESSNSLFDLQTTISVKKVYYMYTTKQKGSEVKNGFRELKIWPKNQKKKFSRKLDFFVECIAPNVGLIGVDL